MGVSINLEHLDFDRVRACRVYPLSQRYGNCHVVYLQPYAPQGVSQSYIAHASLSLSGRSHYFNHLPRPLHSSTAQVRCLRPLSRLPIRFRRDIQRLGLNTNLPKGRGSGSMASWQEYGVGRGGRCSPGEERKGGGS